jgi:hypothetical protein
MIFVEADLENMRPSGAATRNMIACHGNGVTDTCSTTTPWSRTIPTFCVVSSVQSTAPSTALILLTPITTRTRTTWRRCGSTSRSSWGRSLQK